MSGHPFEFIFGPPPSEEERQEAMRRHDQAHMEQQSLRHEVAQFIDDLNEDGLRVLRAIISATSGDEGYGQYMMGQLTAMLHVKHSLCVACGKNHDKELQATLETVSEPTPVPTPESGDVELSDEARRNVMLHYGLRYPEEGEVDARSDERPVICIQCNMLYQSVEDRMKRPAGIDGCHGCQHKSAHG